MSGKTKFYVYAPVEVAEGYQVFTVLADSEEEALAIFKDKGGEFDEEQIEVKKLGEASIVGQDDEGD